MNDALANLGRFDAMAAEWDDSPLRAGIARAVATAIAGTVPLRPDMRALEYGCGTGLVGVLLAERVAHIVAADVAPNMLRVLDDKCRRAGRANIETRRLDLTVDPPPAERFDLIFSSMTLHHIEDVDALLGALTGLLTPGGWLALADLDREDGSFHGPDVPGVFHCGFERARLMDRLRALGLVDVTARTAHTVHKAGADGERRAYPIFLISARRGDAV
ncbi:MAG: class I SAM-dependent methyltransferase [Immundisolibacter sp.]